MPEPRQAGKRDGPRPLGLHLGTASAVWQSSRLALPLLRSAEVAELPEPLTALEALRPSLRAAEAEPLQAALEREIARRADALARGIEAYRRHPHRRRPGATALAWQEGTSRLWDYGPGDGRPILLVPSLINRSTVLDLDEGHSLCRWLAAKGFRPFLVDWDTPAEEECGFTLTDYVSGRLSAMLDCAGAAAGGQRPLVLGYCLGGNLALGLACLRQEAMAGLALLATPWDFHAGLAVPPANMRLAALLFAPLIETFGVLPVDAVQSLFYALDPWLAVRKFSAFGRRDQQSGAARTFVALEDWLNDGVPLAGPVAREVLTGWYAENRPARGLWRLAGRPMDPGRLALPSLAMIPEGDRIVPPSSALALAEAMPGLELHRPPAGHVGMIVGSKAVRHVWQPLADWASALPP